MSSGIRLTTQEFIQRSQIIHHNRYDYSKVNYINYNTKIILICPIHGDFLILPWKHLKGSGCTKCSKKYRKNQTDFLKECQETHHNRYDYSKSIYKNEKTKVIIICKIHGEFQQSPEKHIKRKHGCPLCGEINFHKPFYTLEIFIQKSNHVHNNKYNYSKVKYKGNSIKVCIICPDHGEFWQTPQAHFQNQGCPKCHQSKGEKQIELWLQNKNIQFIPQHKFNNCKNPKTNYFLYFDFYIPDYNTCIEYDGAQHFKSISYFGGHKYFNEIKFKDKIKNIFCKKYKINLIRISYKDFSKINQILSNKFSF